MALDKPLSIFIVDDDPDVIQAMTIILEGEGHRVHSDLLSATAISDIARRRPDVVLTDLVMGGVDGLELCRELRARPELSSLKIIFVSSKTDALWAEKAAEAGAIGFIHKPVDQATFASELESIVEAAT